MSRRGLAAATLALALAGAARPARAQRLEGELVAASLEHRVQYQGRGYRQTGRWLGARAVVRAGAWRLEAGTLAGTLGGDSDPANPDRDVRSTTIEARRRLATWLELGVSAEARRFSSVISATTWRAAGPTARVETALGVPELRGFASLTLFPVAGGSDAVAPASAARGVVGLALAPPEARVGAVFAYRFERVNVDDPASADRRHEHFEGLLIGAAVRFGR